MGFDQKLKDLLKLQTTQPDAFTAKLDEPWPGMQSDIELALGILLEYQRQGSEMDPESETGGYARVLLL